MFCRPERAWPLRAGSRSHLSHLSHSACVAGIIGPMIAFRLFLKNRDVCRTLAAFALVFTAGCEGGGGGEPAEPEILYEDYAAAFEDAWCTWRAQCNLEESVESCREISYIDRDDTYVSAAVEAGTIRFDGAAAYRCLEETLARGCERAEPAAPSCAEVLVGQVGPEDPCMISDECVEGGVCGFDPSCADECCAGACRLLPGPAEVGESCVNQNVDCVEGAYCARDPMTFQRTVCTAQVAIGGACSDSNMCEDAGFCNFNNGLCEPRLGEGASCFGAGNACAEGLRCEWVGGDSYEEQYCVSSVSQALLGELCQADLGQWGCAEHGVICSLDSVCVLAPGANEPCVDFDCADYAYCNDANVCVVGASLGEPCGYRDNSYSGYVHCAGALICGGDSEFSQKCVDPQFSADLCEVPGTPFNSSSGG